VRPLAAAVLALGILAVADPARAAPSLAEGYKVGVAETAFVDTARQRPLKVRIWYPASPLARERSVTYDFSFKGRAAHNAEYVGGELRRSLILLSHGDRGSNADQCWLAEVLARHGHIVAAVTHYKNNNRDSSPEYTIRAWERPQDVSFVASRLLEAPAWAARIDPARIGAAGHSSGGYTALSLAGAVYRPLLMGAYCASSDAGPDCALARDAHIAGIDFAKAADSYRDDRIRAAFAMAPALGPGIDAGSLKRIAIPVHVVAARDDELVLYRDHASRYAAGIPGAELTALDEGGHFSFMPRCSLVVTAALYFYRHDICGSHSRVDRDAVHEAVAARAVDFFGRTLKAGAP
jgi:predicted dienelactone hydrolase